MTPPDRMAEKLDRIISMLEQPLGAEDVEGGWVDQSRMQWHQIFSKLREHVRCGRLLDPEYRAFFVARGLDGWGIGGGPLCHLAVEIGCDLCDAVRDEVRARGEASEEDDSEIGPDAETMRYLDRLLAGEVPDTAQDHHPDA